MTSRTQLVDVALRLLEDEGLEALRARRLAREAGASTMAIYTHFGGMPALVEAMVAESFARFGSVLGDVPRSDDPIADLFALGLAYRDYALASPQAYRLMFGVAGAHPVASHPRDLTTHGTPSALEEADATFQQLVAVVSRAMDTGRLDRLEPSDVAGQIWSAVHGYVLLELSGVFGREGNGVVGVLGPLTLNLLAGLGDRREAAEASARAALERVGASVP